MLVMIQVVFKMWRQQVFHAESWRMWIKAAPLLGQEGSMLWVI